MPHEKKLSTMLAHFAEDRAAHHGAVVPPIYQNSLFTFADWESIDAAFADRLHHFIYSRGNNPTVATAEAKIARLAGGDRARLFGSGMAAVSAVLLHLLEPGDHVIAVKNVYGPTAALLDRYLRRKMNIETTFVSGEDPAEFEAALTGRTRVIYLESPSSAVFSLQDIEAVAALARKHGVRTVIDNSWATPIFQKPLALGVDFELHSCSKYLGGHSDVVAGVVIGREADMEAISLHEVELLGARIAPFEAWLLIRSLRTLPMRMARHQENALAVARFLEAHPRVRQVRYPGLESFPQYELGKKQMSGYSGLLAFDLDTDDLDRIRAFFDRLQIFQIGVSWGGHESLIYAPAISYAREMPPEHFQKLGLTPGTMRISVGLEDAEDLIADLEQALAVLS